MKRKITMAAVLFLLLTVLLSACDPIPPSEAPNSSEVSSSSVTSVQKKPKIGIAFPTQSLPRWGDAGKNLKERLEAAGYEVELQFGPNSGEPLQIQHVQNMISDDCTVLVICPMYEEEFLTTALEGAKSENIPVISYERRIMNTDAVSYHVAFDCTKIGAVQGQYIVDRLDLKNQDGPFNIELFAGGTNDKDTILIWQGAMDILQPYIDSGKLVIESGLTEIQQCTIDPKWESMGEALSRMVKLVDSQGYGAKGTKLDAVLSPNDAIAQGITMVLEDLGYTADNFPIITGQDCDEQNVKNIINGTQHMSVFYDTNDLVERTAKMVISIVNGEEPEINDRETYDNGFGPVPAYLCDPSVVVTKDNYKEVLIDSGYYQEWIFMVP